MEDDGFTLVTGKKARKPANRIFKKTKNGTHIRIDGTADDIQKAMDSAKIGISKSGLGKWACQKLEELAGNSKIVSIYVIGNGHFDYSDQPGAHQLALFLEISHFFQCKLTFQEPACSLAEISWLKMHESIEIRDGIDTDIALPSVSILGMIHGEHEILNSILARNLKNLRENVLIIGNDYGGVNWETSGLSKTNPCIDEFYQNSIITLFPEIYEPHGSAFSGVHCPLMQIFEVSPLLKTRARSTSNSQSVMIGDVAIVGELVGLEVATVTESIGTGIDSHILTRGFLGNTYFKGFAAEIGTRIVVDARGFVPIARHVLKDEPAPPPPMKSFTPEERDRVTQNCRAGDLFYMEYSLRTPFGEHYSEKILEVSSIGNSTNLKWARTLGLHGERWRIVPATKTLDSQLFIHSTRAVNVVSGDAYEIGNLPVGAVVCSVELPPSPSYAEACVRALETPNIISSDENSVGLQYPDKVITVHPQAMCTFFQHEIEPNPKSAKLDSGSNQMMGCSLAM